MIIIPSYIRIFQTKEQSDEYTLYNSKTGNEYIIDYTLYEILYTISTSRPNTFSDCKAILKNAIENYNEIFEILKSEQFIVNSLKHQESNILPSKKNNYPLTALSIELINTCTLKCIHCYGAFSETPHCMLYTFEDIVKLKPEFDILHVSTIVLTGGDVFLNKDLNRIALYLLENGFKLSILANGWSNISSFCDSVKDYKLSISFSIDGLKETHDIIRGRKNSFENVMNSIATVSKYSNISIKISTTVMRKNLNEINDLKKFIYSHYPTIPFRLGLIIPVETTDQSFSLDELDNVYNACPDVLHSFIKEKDRKERCQGGVSIGALQANKDLTICIAARDKKFVFGNISQTRLSQLWNNPNIEIEKMRMEKHFDNIKCKQCETKEKCRKLQNCRVYAQQYKGTIEEPNPICCFLSKNILSKRI